MYIEFVLEPCASYPFRCFDRLPMHALGSSLADVAAFMQEVEIDFGMNPTSGEDRRGIDRLRVLARQLQNQLVNGEDEHFTPWR
jgi:hypothetical protein